MEKLKRSDVYIIANGEEGKTVYKKKGYIFQKNGHWFTIRHKEAGFDASITKKWIVSDLVTGVKMVETDSKLDDVPDALTDYLINKLIELYKDDSTSIYKRESSHEEFKKYALMINDAMLADGQNKLGELLLSSAEDFEELF